MKKFLTFALVCCLVFSFSSTVFATATQWDTSDQNNLKYIANSVTSGGSLYTIVNNIYSRLNTINNNLTDIKGYLLDSNHGVAYWVHSILTWMSPIYTAIEKVPVDLESIKGLLSKVDIVDGVSTYDPYLGMLAKSMSNYYVSDTWDLNKVRQNAHANLINDYSNGKYTLRFYARDSGTFGNYDLYWNNGSPIGNVASILWLLGNSFANFTDDVMYNFNSVQTAVNWTDLNNKSFTPSSQTNGIYQWLSNIQAPVARLSYVLASDERIEAQEKAADNEQAVVDNFIDSSGSGAASTSDFGSVSDLSSGFKNNISTDASVSGIWNIFNSDNFGWFSQETADQLDTTGSGNRTLRSSGSYPTPLLDQQTEDILKYIGGDDND